MLTLADITKKIKEQEKNKVASIKLPINLAQQVKTVSNTVKTQGINKAANMLSTVNLSKVSTNADYEKNRQNKFNSDILNFGSVVKNNIISGTTGIANYLTNAVKNNININKDLYSNKLSIKDNKGNIFTPNIPNNNILESTVTKGLNSIDKVTSDYMKSKDEQSAKAIENIQSPFLKQTSKYAGAIGKMVPTIGASLVNPGLGFGVATTSAGGQYIQDAKSKGATDKQAFNYGSILGLAEGATEMLGIGALTKGAKQVAKGGIKAGLKSLGISAIDNAIQEAAMEPATELTSQAILGKSNWKDVSQRMLQSGIDGALVSLIMAGASGGLAKSVNIANKIESGQQVTDLELQQAKAEVEARPLSNTIKPQTNDTLPIVTSPQVNTNTLNNNVTSNVPTKQDTLKPVIGSPINIQNTPVDNMKVKLPTTFKTNNDIKVEGEGQSSFINNIEESKILSKEAKELLTNQTNIKYYYKINNTITLEQANNELLQGGQQAVNAWFNTDNKKATAKDITKGIILMENYQKQGDYVSMVETAKKLRNMGTEAGQTVQAFSIMQRMTPEGMIKYTQSQLSDVYDELLKSKTREWIAQNVGDLTLTEQETQNIVQKMQQVQQVTDQRQKVILLAEIQKIVTDKIPPKTGDSIKAYRRIAMLLNPKTIVRNTLGNTLVAPLNMASESTIGTLTDKILSKKTGVRTTGVTNLKTYGKEFLKGGAEAFDDFRKGINTRDINGDKFEIGRGKNFKNKGLGKVMNKIDALTSFTLDVGDRPFFKAEFMNSLNNQMKLNNVTEATTDMIDIATKIAEQRTWQDSNTLSSAALGARNKINEIGHMSEKLGIGMGDIILPFAKTPANLTKALWDYSPAGVINAILDNNNLTKAIKNDTFTPQLQKKLVDDVSKAFAGTMLYVVGIALAKAGITSGEGDKDKDLAKFKKDIMGIQPYSIKIGDKSFTYDWAQPLAAPLGIMANVEQNNKNENEKSPLYENIFNAITVGGNMLYEQSFLQSVKKIFTSYDGPVAGIIDTVATVPASFMPTFIKQLNDIIDPIQRNTYEYEDTLKTSFNQTIAKIPGLSQTLPASKDVLGRDVKKYGGENNPLNIFLNPANVNKENATQGSLEVLKVLEKTGDKTIIPRLANNYFEYKNEKYTLTAEEKTKWQENIGIQTDKALTKLASDKNYQKLSEEEKAKVIKSAMTDIEALQKQEYLLKKDTVYEGISDTLVEAQQEIAKGLPASSYYVYKNTIANLEGNKTINEKGKEVTIDGSTMGKKAQAIVNMNLNDTQKNQLLDLAQASETPVKYDEIKNLDKSSYQTYFGLTTKQREDYLRLKKYSINETQLNKYYAGIGKVEGQKVNGKTISGSKKQAVYNYINSLLITPYQKRVLFENAGYKL